MGSHKASKRKAVTEDETTTFDFLIMLVVSESK